MNNVYELVSEMKLLHNYKSDSGGGGEGENLNFLYG